MSMHISKNICGVRQATERSRIGTGKSPNYKGILKSECSTHTLLAGEMEESTSGVLFFLAREFCRKAAFNCGEMRSTRNLCLYDRNMSDFFVKIERFINNSLVKLDCFRADRYF